MASSAPEQIAGEKPRDIKLNNRRIVLELLQRGDRVSLGQLAESCNLSRNTIKKCMDFFIQKGIAADAGKGSSTSEGGKKPDLFILDESWGVVGSIYSAGNMLYGALYSIGLTLLTRSEEDLSARHQANTPAYTPDELVAGCGRLMRRMLADAGKDPALLKSVTCSIHGVVDVHTGTVFSSGIGGWNGQVPLGKMLSDELFGVTVFCCNPVRSMMLSEAGQDPTVADNSVLLYTHGHGGMAAVIRGGHIVQGKRCVLGEISGIPLNFTSHPDSDTSLGGDSLGVLVCRERLLNEISSNPALYLSSSLSGLGREPELADLFAAAEAGDELGQVVMRYAARWFAVSLRQLLFLADPDIIIIQGDYAKAGGYFLQTLQRYVQSYVAPSVSVIPDIRLSHQDEIASCMRGGAIVCRNRVFASDEMYE